MSTGRRFAVGVFVALVGASLMTGCGVPTSSEVELVGSGPPAGPRLTSGKTPPGPNSAGNERDLVENFLQAAAGSPDIETAMERVREFLHPSDQQKWEPEQQLRVIRLQEDPRFTDAPGGWRVEIRGARPVGELTSRGYLDAPAAAAPQDYQFRVVREPTVADGVNRDPRLRIADAPPYILLRDTAVANEDYYYPYPIYFWDRYREVLVPDLRWLPLGGPEEQHPFTVVSWLLAGPAQDLRLLQLPENSATVSAPVWETGPDRLVVNLNAAAGDVLIEELATQLTWTLQPLLQERGAQLELQIEGQRTEYPPVVWPRREAPHRFAVLDGAVQELIEGDAEGTSPAALSEDANTGVHTAALSRDGRTAALVREQPTGALGLAVSRARRKGTEVSDTGLVGSQLGRPIWLDSDRATGLVVADGELYRFTAESAERIPVSGFGAEITSVAVSPEARRVAVIAGDRLFVAPLRFDDGSATVHSPRPLPTTAGTLAGVAFSSEYELVTVGEARDRVGLYRLTVDGLEEDRIRDLGNASVTHLVAHPAAIGDDRLVMMYETNEGAYSFTGSPSQITVADLVDPPETDSNPRAPFFTE